MSTLFSINRYPTLLPQIVEAANRGLEANPPSFEPLQQLMDFFQLRRLRIPSLAGRVSVLEESSLKLRLEELLQREAELIAEYEAANPYEPSTILNRYSKKIHLYLKAFFNHLGTLSKEERDSLKEAIGERDIELLSLFIQLSPGVLDPYRERAVFNGVMRFVYEEAEKAFSLLDRIEKESFPRSLKEQFDLIFSALMKLPHLTEERLPLPFKKVSEKVLGYQGLREEEKEKARAEILYDVSFDIVPLHLLLFI